MRANGAQAGSWLLPVLGRQLPCTKQKVTQMLTETEIAFIRDVVGESPSDAELQEIYERAGTTGGVVYVVLSQQLTELIRNPANFNVSGEYSQDTRTNIEALQKRIAQFAGFAPDAEDYQPTQVRVVEPSRRRRR